jgi:hypothetical protein
MNKHVFPVSIFLLSIVLLIATATAIGRITATALAPASPDVACDDITQIPEQECLALQAFYDSTNGGEWSN